jgi:hypothetical protein
MTRAARMRSSAHRTACSSQLTIRGASDTRGRGIDDRGRITGNYRNADGVEHGFVRDKSGFHAIDVPDAATTDVWDIDVLGRMIGDTTDTSGIVHGYVYEEGTFRLLDFPGAAQTSTRGISASGVIVGLYSDDFDAVFLHGLEITSDGAMHSFDVPGAVLEAGGTSGFAVNARGDIVGDYNDATGLHGFVRHP